MNALVWLANDDPALGIKSPWFVQAVAFDASQRRLTVQVEILRRAADLPMLPPRLGIASTTAFCCANRSLARRRTRSASAATS